MISSWKIPLWQHPLSGLEVISEEPGSGVAKANLWALASEVAGSLTVTRPTSLNGGVESKLGAAALRAGQLELEIPVGGLPEAMSSTSVQAVSYKTGSEKGCDAI